MTKKNAFLLYTYIKLYIFTYLYKQVFGKIIAQIPAIFILFLLKYERFSILFHSHKMSTVKKSPSKMFPNQETLNKVSGLDNKIYIICKCINIETCYF